MKRKILFIASLCILSMFMIGARKKSMSMLVKASLGDASYLNPVLASDSASGEVNDLVFNGLLKYNEDLELIGDLAESYELSKDKLKIIFHLRKDVQWHDGEKFDAEDVLYTFKVIKSEKTRTPYSSKFDDVKTIESPDPYTVIVTYARLFSPALQSWGMGILPAHIYENTDINTNAHNRKPIGTGPYKFVTWKSDDRILLKSNPEYFESTPGIDRVILKIVPDLTVQLMELKKGILDWISPNPEQWNKETSDEKFNQRFQRFRYPSFNYTYMGYNLNNELFKDPMLRRALSHAIDKKKIIAAVLQGLGEPATGPYPPSSWAYDSSIKGYNYDPAQAKKILADLGWKIDPSTKLLSKNGKQFSFTLMTNQGNTMRRLCCEIIQSQLAEIGIEVKLRIQEWSSFIHQYVDKKNFDAILMGWSTAVDPDNYSIWHSSQINEGQYNFVSYSNPEVDRLLEAGRMEYDINIRKKIYSKIHRILQQDQPYLFLYFADSTQILNKKVKNIKLTKSGIGHNFIDWEIEQ